VARRARNRCEYCGTAQTADLFLRFHVEHILPRQHGGGDDDSNLALACFHCNLHKGPNLTAIDPLSANVVVLFNPRTQRWDDHFSVLHGVVTGLTPAGRATVRLLAMNDPSRVRLRFDA
jgi:5-methylcytosine-specific restriction endonuclease McrA